mmetsp:Transcript_8127/g.10578  ORF Transcript_8127/g.10578 Transcript_8127/m.10578 type:complete len:86 (-) Transcript_8127:708-965(-)
MKPHTMRMAQKRRRNEQGDALFASNTTAKSSITVQETRTKRTASAGIRDPSGVALSAVSMVHAVENSSAKEEVDGNFIHASVLLT